MAAGERTDSDDVDIVLGSHAGGFLRLLKEGADVDVEPEIRVGGGDDLCATVVAILSHLCDEDAGTAAILDSELFGQLEDFLNLRGSAEFRLINATHRTDESLMAVELFFQCIGDFSKGGAGPGGVDSESEEVALAGNGRLGESGEGGLNAGLVATGLD